MKAYETWAGHIHHLTRRLGRVFSFGDLEPEYAIRSLELFASEVLPGIRSALE